MYKYDIRNKILSGEFAQGKNLSLDDTSVNIHFFKFVSKYISNDYAGLVTDTVISENFSFEYPVFLPSGNGSQFSECIVLLHGLNERSWNKYLTWAEFLCINTGKPVILFPIAFHMNRAPLSWSNPRKLTDLLNYRRDVYEDERSISFANVALSNRISEHPERFYLSGRQTWYDLTGLFETIKSGRHILFKENAQIDVFAYSIGAFLSQVAFMANRKGLFSDSRLFMFCGGSIFRSMQGISRNILDRPAFEKLQHYYNNIFGVDTPLWKRDEVFDAFLRMIAPNRFRKERESFFTNLKKRIKGISLVNDTVIPYHGILEAMGSETTKTVISDMDFDFKYTHENPFPINSKETTAVNSTFREVFSKACDFFG